MRERYIAEAVAPMITARRVEAAKLDLILRGLALRPDHAGRREPGHLPRHEDRLSYQVLHDLCRDHARFAEQAPHDIEDDRDTHEKKRNWVRVQLRELERRSLVVRRTDPQGRRPDIIVLRDLGDGEPYCVGADFVSLIVVGFSQHGRVLDRALRSPVEYPYLLDEVAVL